MDIIKQNNSADKNILSRKYKTIAAVLIILAAGWIFWDKIIKKEPPETKKIPETAVSPIPVKQGELASGFPDIPLNKKTIITDSSALYDKDIKSVTEASVVFESLASAGENNVFYEKWAKDYNWQITAADKDSFHLSKENETVNIVLNAVSDKKTKINILYRKTLPKEIDKKLQDSFKNLKF